MRIRLFKIIQALSFLLCAAAAHAQLTVVEYPIPTPNSTPAHITAGPDGALWFTENAVGQVGRVTINGSFTEFSVTAVGAKPNGIVGGSDGALWFTDSNAAAIGRITTSGAVTKYPISGPAGNPVNFQPGSSGGIVAGPDGAIWTFVNSNSNPSEIVRITPEATTAYPLPATSGVLAINAVQDITSSASDGAIWFTLSGHTLGAPVQPAPAVGRITASGVITIFPLPIGEGAGNILAGPDGTIWFDVLLPGQTPTEIGRITTTGVIAYYTNGLEPDIPEYPGEVGPYKIVAQGAVWTLSPEIEEFGLQERLTRIDTSGELTTYQLSALPPHQFRDITLGPDGELWLLDLTNKIGRVGVPSQPLAISAFSLPLVHIGVPYSTTFSATGGTPPYSKWSFGNFSSHPPGLTLDPSSGTLSGTPLGLSPDFFNGGTLSFTVTVQDATGVTASRQGSITVDPSIPGSSLIGSIPHLAADENWTTSFTLVNKSATIAEAKLNFFGDPNGVLPLVLAPVTRSGSAFLTAVLDQMFNANASLVANTVGPQTAPVQVGAAQLSANGAVDGFAIFHHIVTQQETVVPLETRNANSYLLAFDNTSGSVLGIAVANVAAQDGIIGVVIRDDSGKQIETSSLAVSANGHTSFALPTQYPVTANLRGTIEFDTPSGGRISVLGMGFTPPNNALTTIPALVTGGGGGSIAHIATGNGWQTTFVLVNTGTVAAPFHLTFFADDGTPLALPIDFPQLGGGPTSVASFVDQSLPAGATLLVDSAKPESDPTPTIGSAQLTSSGTITGYVIFRYTPHGQEAVVPFESRMAAGYILAFDNTSGTATGVAVNSVSAESADVPVIIRNENGTSIATDTIHLAPNGHSAFTLVSDKYPMTANIRGTIEFDTPPGGQVGALAFRFPLGHTFTTLPALAK